MRPDLHELLRCPSTGARLVLDAVERDGDDVVYGVLRAEGEEYPVLAGVPVLLPGYGESVRLVRSGRLAEASAAAVVRQLDPSRLGRLAAALGAFRTTRRAGSALGDRDRRRLQAALAPELDPDARDPLAMLRLGFEGWNDRNPEAVHYFIYRLGTPRHLVALAAVEAAAPDEGLLLDLGCGAGHLTWGLRQRFGEHRTIGLDLSMFELWAAGNIAGRGRFVCADAAMLPFASGSFGLVLASDVLSFVRAKWPVAREAARVLAADGTLAVVAVKSSLQPHVYAGMPVSPGTWRALAGALPACLYADDTALARYFDGLPLDGRHAGDPERSATVTLLAGARSAGAHLSAPAWPASVPWPHARGPLGVNPLLRLVSETPDAFVYRRELPSRYFSDDNAPLADYLPERVEIPRTAVDGDHLVPHLVQHLVSSTAVLALPRHHRESGLPRGHRTAGATP